MLRGYCGSCGRYFVVRYRIHTRIRPFESHHITSAETREHSGENLKERHYHRCCVRDYIAEQLGYYPLDALLGLLSSAIEFAP